MITGGILAIVILLAIIYGTLVAQAYCIERYMTGKTKKQTTMWAQLGVCLLVGTVVISTATYKGFLVGSKMLAMW